MVSGSVVGIIPIVLISIFTWIRNIFILNKFNGFRDFSHAEFLSLGLYVIGGYGSWIATMAVLEEDLFPLQLCASFYRQLVNWIGLVFVINQRFFVTRQQVGSLIFVFITGSLWEVQYRLMLS